MRRAIFPPLFAAAVLVTLSATGWSTGLAHANSPVSNPPIALGETGGEHGSSEPKGQPSSDALKKEFTTVIESQLAAFRAGEYEKAYSFAASQIKDKFPVESFKEMVTTAYPVIAHSVTAEFGLAIDTGDEAVINVRIEDADKKSILYQYVLEKQDGKWKIGGVAEVKASGLSV